MTAIPDFLRDKALSRGIPAEQIPELWGGHTKWADEHGKDYGGRLWDGLLDKVIERLKDQTQLGDEDAERAQATAKRIAAERAAKDADDAEYARHAVGLRTWVASLRAQALDGEALSPHEAVLARGELPQGNEDAADWLMASLGAVRDFRGAVPVRPNPCGHPGCGLPVHKWVGFGTRVYFSGRCVDHERTER